MAPNERANRYRDAVLSGKQSACRWIRLACERQIRDLARTDWEWEYSPERGDAVCQFVELFKHTKGKWAANGEAIRLEDWQCFFLCTLFGWVNKKTGKRRFRTAGLYVPRKNGKSLIAAAIGLYMLTADGETGAEVYSGATTEKQAWEVFRPAKQMAAANQQFIDYFGVDVMAKSIVATSDSRFQAVIGNPGDGASPSCAIVDEYHEHETNRMVETMTTGMMAREQPLLLVITTAGDNLGGPCFQMQMEAQAMLEGTVKDERLFAMIYTIDTGDDWASVETLKKANPNFGVSVLEDVMLSVLEDAKQSARKQTAYKTKHLNQWVGARDVYFNIDKWMRSADPKLSIDDFKGRTAYIGLDLASKVDIAAVVVIIPDDNGHYVEFGRYYLPEAALSSGACDHYRGWAAENHLQITDGNIIDFAEIETYILWLCDHFDVSELAYDPHQATMLVTRLMDQGVPCVEARQSTQVFSEPMKMTDALIRGEKIRHTGCPVMTWMLSNTVAKANAKEEVYPRKLRDEDKIDGVVAMLMAMGRALAGGTASTEVESGFVCID